MEDSRSSSCRGEASSNSTSSGGGFDAAFPGPLSKDGPSFLGREEPGTPALAIGVKPGEVVGDFRLTRLIGQGGMGQVWEAEQLSLDGRKVAARFVRPERVTQRQLDYFEREARAGGRLSHDRIVRVYGHGDSRGIAWISMELVEGGRTIRDLIDDVSRADEVPAGYDLEVARFVAEIADGVQAAHDAGVIHRDLKPQNVLITPGSQPKVTDFGLARITDESGISETGDVAGTYNYMSPEQVAARRSGIDHRTDVFSLGVVLYEMLALQRPFQGDTSHQVIEQIVTRDPPDPRTFRSRIPGDLVVIVGKALEKDRKKRFASMADLSADLRRFLAGEPILARPPAPLDRATKWMRRNPVKSTSAAILVVALALVSALLAWNVRESRAVKRLSALQDLADLLAEAGVPPAKLQRLMRHATVELTMRYYVHLDVDSLGAGLSALAGIEGGTASREAAAG